MCKFVRRLFIAIGVMAVLIVIIAFYLRSLNIIPVVMSKRLVASSMIAEPLSIIGYAVCEIHIEGVI